MNDPRPPLAPVIRTILFFIELRSSMAGCFLTAMGARSRRKVSNGVLHASASHKQLRRAKGKRGLGVEAVLKTWAAIAITHRNAPPVTTDFGVADRCRVFAVNTDRERSGHGVVGLVKFPDPRAWRRRKVHFRPLASSPALPPRDGVGHAR